MGMYDSGAPGASGLGTKYGIGELADLVGVPPAFDAGDSFWLAAGHRFHRDQVPLAARKRLASVDTGLASLANPVRDKQAADCANLSASVPPAIVGGVTVFQTRRPGHVLVIDSSGPRLVNTGLTGMVAVISDGSAFWAFSNNAVLTSDLGAVLAANGGLAKSTDGATWIAQAVTGWPAGYILRNALYPFTTGSGATSSAQGYKPFDYATCKQSGVFWTGSRYLAVVDDGANFKVCRSTNCLAWTDDTTQVLGGAVAAAGTVFFYRNGNNCFLKVGTAYRYSTDGGANWSTCAVPPTVLNGLGYLQRSASNPALLVATQNYTGLFVSTDSGQTWADRSNAIGSIGSTTFDGGVAIIGSTILILTISGLKRSSDGGATWANVVFPNTVQGNPSRVVADAYRAYVILSNKQVLTTTDGSTYLVRSASMVFVVSSAAALSSTVTLFTAEIAGTGMAGFTLDGGVTFTSTMNMRSGSYGIGSGHCTCIGITAGAASYFVGGTENTNYDQRQFIVDLADIEAGGAMFMIANTIVPVRTGTTTYVRVL